MRYSREDILKINRFLHINICKAELLSLEYESLIQCGRNILSLVWESPSAETDYYEDLESHERFFLNPGYIYLLPCNRRVFAHRTRLSKTVTIHFDFQILSRVDVFSTSPRCIMEYNPGLIDDCRQIMEDEDSFRACFRLQSLVVSFCAAHWPDGFSRRIVLIEKYKEVFDYIHANCDAELTVGELAELLHVRPNYFSREFARDFGETPKRYIMTMLTQRIIADLLLPGMTIKEIAAKLNFSSEFYLSRFFKKQTGYAPREYRNAIQPREFP